MSSATLEPVTTTQQVNTLVELAVRVRPGQHMVVTDVSWEEYEALLEWRDHHRPRSVYLTYDQGRLEIMVIGNLHERLKKVLDLLVVAWIEETGGEYLPSGQLTHKREDLERGFEPDECYYIQNWKKVAGLREIDFIKDPPPDLMLEVEVSHTVMSRLLVIAAFKIPEVWRFDGDKITILMLKKNGEYRESTTSRAIPNFPFTEALRFLELTSDISLSFASIGRRFREWIRTLPRKSKS